MISRYSTAIGKTMIYTDEYMDLLDAASAAKSWEEKAELGKQFAYRATMVDCIYRNVYNNGNNVYIQDYLRDSGVEDGTLTPLNELGLTNKIHVGKQASDSPVFKAKPPDISRQRNEYLDPFKSYLRNQKKHGRTRRGCVFCCKKSCINDTPLTDVMLTNIITLV